MGLAAMAFVLSVVAVLMRVLWEVDKRMRPDRAQVRQARIAELERWHADWEAAMRGGELTH